MSKLQDLTGKIFGRWTVIEKAKSYISPKGYVKTMWLCECSCDKHTRKIVSGNSLKNRTSTSCGCYADELFLERNIKHGQTNTRLYRIWSNMKKRCYNENDPKYKNYGFRGISICSEWKDNFVSFKDWALSNGYSDCLTIDRVDNNGNYEPSNCRWVDIKTQNNNRRSNKMIEYNGEKHNLKEWTEILSLPYSPIELRISRGWNIDDAFTTPIRETN